MAALEDYNWDDAADGIEETMRLHYPDILQFGFEEGAAELPVELSWDATNERVKDTEDRLALRIRGVADTTRSDIAAWVTKGYDAGLTAKQIADHIRESAPELSKNRANLIARTELGTGANLGHILAYRDAGVSKVKVLDGDGDAACAEANGQTWTVDEAEAEPLAHPGCVRSFAPIVEDLPEQIDEPTYEAPMYEVEQDGDTWRVGPHTVELTGALRKGDFGEVGTINGIPFRWDADLEAGTKQVLRQYVTETIVPALQRTPLEALANLMYIRTERITSAAVGGWARYIEGTGQAGITMRVSGKAGSPRLGGNAAQALIHEIGHVREFSLTEKQARAWLDAVGYEGDKENALDLMRAVDDRVTEFAVRGPTEYGRSNAAESWAETYRLIHNEGLGRDLLDIGSEAFAEDREFLAKKMREILSEPSN